MVVELTLQHVLVEGDVGVDDRLLAGVLLQTLQHLADLGERLVARRWQKRWPQIDFAYDRSGTKGTLIGRVIG